MQLERLIITDYGPYAGRNEFNLRTTPEAPIVLFGGKNGAGKTTLFQTIQICLHGRSAFGRRVSQSEYKQRIRDKMHESGGTKASTAAVKMEFKYGNFGDADDYVVERSWRDRGESIVEDLTIHRNGSPLSDLEEEQWEDFLKELIPPGVSQLFFFDGEQIQELATAIEEGNDFEESLFSLLGLDLVDRLEADLSIYLSNKLDEEGQEDLAAEIEDLRDRVDELKARRDQLERQIEDKQERIQDLNDEIEQKENELAQEGGGFAEQRDELKETRTQLETEIDQLEEEIRELIRGAYPFALVPDLCRDVVDRLQEETEAATQAAALGQVVKEMDAMAEDEEVWADVEVSPDESEVVIDRLQSELSDRFVRELPGEYRLSKAFSERQRQEMYALVDEALNEVPERLRALTDELERKVRERQEIEQQLSRAPEQSVISPIIDRINELSEQRAQLKAEIETHRDDLEDLETNLQRAEQELENKLDQQDELDDVSRRADLASRVRSAVTDYREELVETKLDHLETELTDRYLTLSNKADYYERVVVDSENVTIEIETKDGDRKDQSQLSAGERQIFATALLWALAKISDRPLPFIIDTPLGRLDQEHRGNLVENFFPEAAHQVILLSTDTEITEAYYDQLEDDIATEYHLQYDQSRGHTTIQPGYFWSDNAAAVPDRDDDTVEVERQVQLGGVNNEQ